MKAAILILVLSGCASGPFVGWCVVPQSGQTDGGLPVIRVVCKADQ